MRCGKLPFEHVFLYFIPIYRNTVALGAASITCVNIPSTLLDKEVMK